MVKKKNFSLKVLGEVERSESTNLAYSRQTSTSHALLAGGRVGPSKKVKCDHFHDKSRCFVCQPSLDPKTWKCLDCKSPGHKSKNSARCSMNPNYDSTLPGAAIATKSHAGLAIKEVTFKLPSALAQSFSGLASAQTNPNDLVTASMQGDPSQVL